jgi:hypothetical protein
LDNILSGPKKPIYSHATPLFLTVAAATSKKFASLGKITFLVSEETNQPVTFEGKKYRITKKTGSEKKKSIRKAFLYNLLNSNSSIQNSQTLWISVKYKKLSEW